MPAHTEKKKVPSAPFGVRVPKPLLHRVEAKRIELGLADRNAAVVRALTEWVEREAA
jgi:hypothetical protein